MAIIYFYAKLRPQRKRTMQEEEVAEKPSKNLISNFDVLLSKPFQKISKIHWTPTRVVVQTAKWLGENPTAKILDIGAGVGKFCIIGASVSNAHFTGVEIRKNLVKEAQAITKKEHLQNVNFLNQNITEVDFGKYNSFYFYNSFCEQIAVADWIDKEVDFSAQNLPVYEKHIYQQLEKKEKGTRIATYCSPNFFLPDSYFASEILEEGDLVFWEKTS